MNVNKFNLIYPLPIIHIYIYIYTYQSPPKQNSKRSELRSDIPSPATKEIVSLVYRV